MPGNMPSAYCQQYASGLTSQQVDGRFSSPKHLDGKHLEADRRGESILLVQLVDYTKAATVETCGTQSGRSRLNYTTESWTSALAFETGFVAWETGMFKRNTIAALAGLLAIGGVFYPPGTPAQESAAKNTNPPLPGGRDRDTALAMNNPSEHAWQLFLALNRQAKLGVAGFPDPNKPTLKQYDPNRPVVWETWAMANGGRAGVIYVPPNQSEVYRDRGVKPVAWNQLPRDQVQPKVFEPYPGKGLEFLVNAGRPPGKFDPVEDGGVGGVEVRMNRGTFDYIRDQGIYSIEGLEARFRTGEELVFPRNAQEVKARWVRIKETDKPRYHWRTVKSRDGGEQLWGLSALHIITRDLPNWFWCDFEHVDFERTAEQYSVDTTTRGVNPPSGREGIRNETRSTKWQTMRLRGTQTAFNDAEGNPNILANTQIEHGFQQSSSCMSCHARATVGLRSARPDLPKWQTNTLPLNLSIGPILREPVGPPKPVWYVDAYGKRRYLQTHFLWSIPFRAMSTKVMPPSKK